MMSKKQWFVLLCMYVVYLLLGTSVYHEVERRAERNAQIEDKKERYIIEDLLIKHYVPSEGHSQDEIFDKISVYCGKTLTANSTDDDDPPLRWDFYHSLFFVVTVVSTVGYGNLAPTTTLTRIFTIFYGIIGISMNGIVIITLGEFFGKSFLKLYDRWKTLRVQHALATLGLVGQIVLYLIPGFTFFIFLPSIIIMVYEGWPYDVAVFYAFVTLTTIGFGDYVAGMSENGYGETLYTIYKIFLLVWIISGLGYIVMVLGFITRGLRSKKMHNLEHKIAHNIKRTNNKIREELRSVLNEYLLMRVKRVYREKFIYVPRKPERSQSCPDLTIYRNMGSPTMARKRAFSESVNRTPQEISRIQSDSDLERIDKERTFKPASAMVEPSQLLLRVVNALGSYEPMEESSPSTSRSEGVDMFPDNEILASERYGSKWSVGSQKFSVLPTKMRPRAASECKSPIREKIPRNNDLTWYGPSATKRLQELREQTLYQRTCKSTTLPQLTVTETTPSFFTRLKNTFKPKTEDKQKTADVEKQDYFKPTLKQSEVDDYRQTQEERRKSSAFSFIDKDHILEETSIADFIRALSAISVPEMTDSQPKRKLGTASLTPPEESPLKIRRSPVRSLFPPSRRCSLVPTLSTHDHNQRRFSLLSDITIEKRQSLTPQPPPYFTLTDENAASNVPRKIITRHRKFSLRPVTSSSSSPVQRHAWRFKQTLPQDGSSKGKDSNA